MKLETLTSLNVSLPPLLKMLTEDEWRDRCIPYSEWKKLSDDDKYNNVKGVIMDNSVWVGELDDGRKYLSSSADSDEVWVSVSSAKVLLHKYVSGGKLHVRSNELLKEKRLNSLEEYENVGGIKMQDVKDLNLEDINDENFNFGELDGLTDIDASVGNLDAFDADAAINDKPDSELTDEERKAKSEAAKQQRNEIKKQREEDLRFMLDNLKQNDISETSVAVRKFAYAHSELIAHITKTDEAIKMSIVNTPIKKNGKYQLDLKKAPEQIRKTFEMSGYAPKEYVLKESKIKFKQTAPGKRLGVLIKIPEAIADLNIADLRSGDKLDETKTNATYRLLTEPVFLSVMATYFTKKIKECPLTHSGNPNKVTDLIIDFVPDYAAQNRKIAKYKEEGSTIPASDVPLDLKPKYVWDKTSRKKLICDTNYFPTKVYITKELNSSIGAADANELNMSLFGNLFAKNTKGRVRMDSLANTEVASKIGYDDKREFYTSEFIRPGNQGTGLPVVSFSTGEQIANPRIPLKTKEVVEGKDRVRFSYRYFDLLNDKSYADVTLNEKWNPLKNDRYKTIVELSGGILTREEIYLTFRSQKKSKKDTGLSASALNMLTTATLNKVSTGKFAIPAISRVDLATVQESMQGIE